MNLTVLVNYTKGISNLLIVLLGANLAVPLTGLAQMLQIIAGLINLNQSPTGLIFLREIS